MKKLVLCLFVLLLLLASFVNAESCLSSNQCSLCGGTPKSYTLKIEGVINCEDNSLSELNGETELVQYSQDWGKCMYYTPGGDGYPIYTELFILNNGGLRVNVISGDTMYFQFNPTSCTETMETEFLSDISCDSPYDENPLYVYGGTATLTPCKENTPPVITNMTKVVYLKEKDNILSLNKTGEKSGKMKINSRVYNTIISDNETKVEDLKLQIGSSKIFPAEPAAQVKFNPEDIGLVFKNLPWIGRFILNVTDDGTTTGQTTKGEVKSGNVDTKVIWCPENVTLYSAYDVGLVASQSIYWGVWPFAIFDKGETIIQRAFKEMSSTLVFTNDEKVPLKGEFHLHLINERVKGLTNSIEKIDATRSKAIKDLQAKMETVLGKIPDEIAKWGCKDGKWGKFGFPAPKLPYNPDSTISIEVCKEYIAEVIEYDMIYSFEKEIFTITGGSGGDVKTIKIKVPLSKFALILDELVDDDPSAIKPPAKLKVGWRSGKDWSWGGMKPSDMIKQTKSLLNLCDINKNQNKIIEAEKDKIKKTITTTSKKSYYYVQEFQSEEDSAIKISLNVPLLEPITKIFNYSQINFTDEDLVSLYRYEDNEIEDLCYVNAISKTNFSISPAGGNFSVQDLEIVIPENAVETNGILTIKKVNVTNCIKDADINKDKKIQTIEMIKYIYEKSRNITESASDFRTLELLFRWRTS